MKLNRYILYFIRLLFTNINIVNSTYLIYQTIYYIDHSQYIVSIFGLILISILWYISIKETKTKLKVIEINDSSMMLYNLLYSNLFFNKITLIPLCILYIVIYFTFTIKYIIDLVIKIYNYGYISILHLIIFIILIIMCSFGCTCSVIHIIDYNILNIILKGEDDNSEDINNK